MRDLDDLLNGDVAGAARRSINPPDFASVRARGHRRRLVVWEAIGGACATAVVAVVTAWSLGVSSTGSPPPDVVVRPSEPDPAPTDRAGLRAERIINDPDAQVVGLSVSPGDPDVRASVWMLCATDRCHDQEYAVAVTEDGYTSHAAVALPARDQPVLTAAGPAAFYVGVPAGPTCSWEGTAARSRSRLLATPVRSALERCWSRTSWPSTRTPRPRTDCRCRPRSPVCSKSPAVDCSVSPVANSFRQAVVVWSDDGGATWDEHVLPAGETSLYVPVRSADDDTIAVVAGTDGATPFPFIAVHRSTDGGATWEVFEQSRDPLAFIDAQLVRPDGSLLVNLLAWGDGTLRRPSTKPVGLYESNGADWTRTAYVDPGFVPGGVSRVHEIGRRTCWMSSFATVARRSTQRTQGTPRRRPTSPPTGSHVGEHPGPVTSTSSELRVSPVVTRGRPLRSRPRRRRGEEVLRPLWLRTPQRPVVVHSRASPVVVHSQCHRGLVHRRIVHVFDCRRWRLACWVWSR